MLTLETPFNCSIAAVHSNATAPMGRVDVKRQLSRKIDLGYCVEPYRANKCVRGTIRDSKTDRGFWIVRVVRIDKRV